MKLTDKQILEFIHAKEVWVWNDDPHKAVNGKPFRLYLDGSDPFEIIDDKDDLHVHKNFPLSKPQVYEDGKWYAARCGNDEVCVRYIKHTKKFYIGLDVFYENELTNIRPIPEELWEGEGK